MKNPVSMLQIWEWLLIATGLTGGWTLVFLARKLHNWFYTPFSVSVHHSPKGGCTEAVVAELNRARREILVQAYSFTSKPIAEALVAAKGRGVHVDILLDRSNEQETYTELGHLLEQGLHPNIDAQHAIAHNKIMIVDRKTIVTGSFNFTNQAEHENAENLLIIRGNPDLVTSYYQQFQAHKAHSQPPSLKAVSGATAKKAA
jgi:phosphatidylserine/phosphatidylglycerophosphate/cardiolipin synthase-like enzyme